MLRLFLVSFRLVLIVASVSGCVNPIAISDHGQSASAKTGYSVTRNLVYTPEGWPEPMMGDLYRPESPVPAPAVLLVHGGIKTSGDGRWLMSPIARRLAKRGYVVLNVTYRSAPWPYPAPVDDLREAVKWMRSHAAEHGIDPERIATFGYSAGGYLAALTGLSERNHIRAIVAGAAPSDLTYYANGRLVPGFLGGSLREIPQRFKEASPVYHVTPDSPPVFLYHGTDDKLVKPEHAWAMIDALERNGVPHETCWIQGRGHIMAFLRSGEAVGAAIEFLDRNTASPE
jgi:acetyl esterase/lipase